MSWSDFLTFCAQAVIATIVLGLCIAIIRSVVDR